MSKRRDVGAADAKRGHGDHAADSEGMRQGVGCASATPGRSDGSHQPVSVYTSVHTTSSVSSALHEERAPVLLRSTPQQSRQQPESKQEEAGDAGPPGGREELLPQTRGTWSCKGRWPEGLGGAWGSLGSLSPSWTPSLGANNPILPPLARPLHLQAGVDRSLLSRCPRPPQPHREALSS